MMNTDITREEIMKEANKAQFFCEPGVVLVRAQQCIARHANLCSETGNPDGSHVDVSLHEKFFDQAKVSLAKWPTDANLDFWMDVCGIAFFDDMIRMESVLHIIYMNRDGE